MTAIRIDAVNALAELERIGWSFEPAGNDEVRCRCPNPDHKDSTPSVSLNVRKNVWACHATNCGAKGDIASFLAIALQVERGTVIADLSSRYDDLVSEKTISPRVVEDYHSKINEAGPLLQALRDRGITDEMIRRHRLGFFKGRITIPVFSTSGSCVNVRRYLPGAPGAQKMKNTPGYNVPPKLYMPDQLKHERVWLCGGEMKAIVAADVMNPIGVGAFCATSAEGTWYPHWNELVKGKVVFICFDVDDAGAAAVRKVAPLIGRVADVRVINLPLDKLKHPKGDINDWVAKEGAGLAEFERAMEAAKPFLAGKGHARLDEPPLEVKLADAIAPAQVGRRVKFSATVSGYFETPYFVPREVVVACDRDQKLCAYCPIYATEPNQDGVTTCEIAPTAEAIVEMIGASVRGKHHAIMRGLNVPDCPVVRFSDRKHYSVYDVRVSPPVSISESSSGSTERLPAFIVDKVVKSNASYDMTAVPYPRPSDQQAVLLVSDAAEAIDTLESYDPTDEELAELEIFQPVEWAVEAVMKKLGEVYDDLAYNVTGIHGEMRRVMHAVMDLAWHSVLSFRHEGRLVKGWVNALVIGDSAQGKTEAATALKAHYGLGERVVCKNASAAGLVGGLQQIGNRWFVSWGLFPQQDRRLVIGEELKGISTQEIARMTDMRSTGVAEIPKIERGMANARTRFLAISNPRDERTVASHSFGVESVMDLIGAPEDVRRFDVAHIVAKGEVPVATISMPKSERTVVESRHTAELCRRLILFGWTRTSDQVRFEDEALVEVRDAALRMCERYSDGIPLVDGGTMHQKIMRLAAAMAVRTFSHEDYCDVLVRRCHVQAIERILEASYSSSTCGYLAYSSSKRASNAIVDPEEVERHLLGCRFPQELIEGLTELDDLTVEDLMALLAVDREGAASSMSLLVRKRCLARRGRGYRKTEAFISFLRRLAARPLPKAAAQVDAGGKEEF